MIWALHGGSPVVLRTPETSVEFVRFRDGGSALISASLLGGLHLWKLPGAVEVPLRNPIQGLTGAALSADGQIIATSHRDHTIVIRDAVSLDPRLTIVDQRDLISKLALNRRGDRLAAANMDGGVRIFELDRAPLRAVGQQEIWQGQKSQLGECPEYLPPKGGKAAL
jgi:WD40 repeat protein